LIQRTGLERDLAVDRDVQEHYWKIWDEYA
jgi:hypothetical protein